MGIPLGTNLRVDGSCPVKWCSGEVIVGGCRPSADTQWAVQTARGSDCSMAASCGDNGMALTKSGFIDSSLR
jgi:hypothetical protein